MATATQKQNSAPAPAKPSAAPQQGAPKPPPGGDSQVLQNIMDNWNSASIADKDTAIGGGLSKRVAALEELLPGPMKGSAKRMILRARMYWRRDAANPKGKLKDCTPASFFQAVLDAAELGLLIDGRLGYAVPYGKEAKFLPSYRGLVAVARRSGVLRDAFAVLVRQGEEFELYVDDGVQRLNHQIQTTGKLGAVAGVYGVFLLPTGERKIEYMHLEQVDHVMQKSAARNNGPWVTDKEEMIRKTVIKRGMKMYEDDPAVGLAMWHENELDEIENMKVAERAEPPAGQQSLRSSVPLPEDFTVQEQADPPPDDPQAPEREVATKDFLDWVANARTQAECFEVIGKAEKCEPSLEPHQLERVRAAGRDRAEELA